MRLALIALPAVAFCAVAQASPREVGAVVVDHVPPDACVAYWGPGLCREHGQTVVGSTDAVAGPPPASWHGKVQARPLPWTAQ